MPEVYLLRADQCPPLPTHSGLHVPALDPAAPLVYAAHEPGQSVGTSLRLNQNNRRNENLARYGGGAYAIAEGRGLSTGGGLTLVAETGATVCDGPQVFPGLGSLAVPNNVYDAGNLATRLHIWQSRTGDLSYRTDLLLPSTPSVYLGSVRTSGGALYDRDRSGVLFLRGGGLYRRTADLEAPTDTPDARLQVVTQTRGGLYLWTGTEHRRLQDDAAPALAAAAEVTNARQVTLQLRNSAGEALSLRRVVRVWLGDADLGAEAAAAPSGGVTVDTGTLLQTVTAAKQYVLLTNASGQAQLTLTESTAKTFWVMAELAGRVTSLAVAFA